jgi:predicted transcriptional regulator
MNRVDVRAELRSIADRLSDSATYAAAMYELYVRMKIAQGREAAAEGRVLPHEEVKRKFIR